jgi:hypothetical protein
MIITVQCLQNGDSLTLSMGGGNQQAFSLFLVHVAIIFSIEETTAY